MTITIHQPDMLPWLGLFNKIDKADLWVILDHTTNNPRDAAFWGRRVKILVNGEGKWLSLPLKKPETSGVIGIPIYEMEFNDAQPKVYQDALRTIEMNYKRAAHYKEIFPIVETFLLSSEMNMSRRNLSFIFQMMELLEIITDTCYSSELYCQESATALLVEILKMKQGTNYLCGGGAGGYQQDELFHQAGIQLQYNNFIHPIYSQRSDQPFVPGLSIIDALMHVGIEATKKLIRNDLDVQV
jgi:hypothetical protein